MNFKTELLVVSILFTVLSYADPQIYYSGYDPDTMCAQIYGVDHDGGSKTRITSDNDGQFGSPYISSDGNSLYYFKYNATTNAGIYKVGFANGSPELLTNIYPTSIFGNNYWHIQERLSSFAPNKDALVFVSDDNIIKWDFELQTYIAILLSSYDVYSMKWCIDNKIRFISRSSGMLRTHVCNENGTEHTILSNRDYSMSDPKSFAINLEGNLLCFFDNDELIVSDFNDPNSTVNYSPFLNPNIANSPVPVFDIGASNIVFYYDSLIHYINLANSNVTSVISRGPVLNYKYHGIAATSVPESSRLLFFILFLLYRKY